MIRNVKRAASLVGIVAITAGAVVGCNPSDNGPSPVNVPDGLTMQKGELVAEGASSQQNAIAILGALYTAANPGATLAYNPTGSGSGRNNFVAGQVDFAGSDSPLKEEQIEPAKERCNGYDAWHLPLAIGPVAIAYHLDNGPAEVNLTAETVAKIFNGTITNWDDAEIQASNPDVVMPGTTIHVIYRSDESGTSDNFQKFLKNAAPDEWDTAGQKFPQAVGAGANGSNGVATEVNNINGGITYAEYGFVKQNKNLKAANIDFGAGQAVGISEESVNKALDKLEFKGEGHDLVVDSDALYGQKEEGAYPLILTTYEIVCSGGYSQAVENRVKDFLRVALENQEEVATAGFIPVRGEHRARLEEAVNAIGSGSSS